MATTRTIVICNMYLHSCNLEKRSIYYSSSPAQPSTEHSTRHISHGCLFLFRIDFFIAINAAISITIGNVIKWYLAILYNKCVLRRISSEIFTGCDDDDNDDDDDDDIIIKYRRIRQFQIT